MYETGASVVMVEERAARGKAVSDAGTGGQGLGLRSNQWEQCS
jgi:hypothetical protein